MGVWSGCFPCVGKRRKSFEEQVVEPSSSNVKDQVDDHHHRGNRQLKSDKIFTKSLKFWPFSKKEVKFLKKRGYVYKPSGALPMATAVGCSVVCTALTKRPPGTDQNVSLKVFGTKGGSLIDENLIKDIALIPPNPNMIQPITVLHMKKKTVVVSDHYPGEPITLVMDKFNHDMELARLLFSQMTACMDYCHGKGLRHYNLNPTAVLVGGPDGKMLKITDWGIPPEVNNEEYEGEVSKPDDYNKYASSDVLFNKSTSMSKQLYRTKYTTPASNVYCMGVILHEMLTGALPFSGSAKEIDEKDQSHDIILSDSLPYDVHELITSMLHPDAEQRPTAHECHLHPWTQGFTIDESLHKTEGEDLAKMTLQNLEMIQDEEMCKKDAPVAAEVAPSPAMKKQCTPAASEAEPTIAMKRQLASAPSEGKPSIAMKRKHTPAPSEEEPTIAKKRQCTRSASEEEESILPVEKNYNSALTDAEDIHPEEFKIKIEQKKPCLKDEPITASSKTPTPWEISDDDTESDISIEEMDDEPSHVEDIHTEEFKMKTEQKKPCLKDETVTASSKTLTQWEISDDDTQSDISIEEMDDELSHVEDIHTEEFKMQIEQKKSCLNVPCQSASPKNDVPQVASIINAPLPKKKLTLEEEFKLKNGEKGFRKLTAAYDKAVPPKLTPQEKIIERFRSEVSASAAEGSIAKSFPTWKLPLTLEYQLKHGSKKTREWISKLDEVAKSVLSEIAKRLLKINEDESLRSLINSPLPAKKLTLEEDCEGRTGIAAATSLLEISKKMQDLFDTINGKEASTRLFEKVGMDVGMIIKQELQLPEDTILKLKRLSREETFERDFIGGFTTQDPEIPIVKAKMPLKHLTFEEDFALRTGKSVMTAEKLVQHEAQKKALDLMTAVDTKRKTKGETSTHKLRKGTQSTIGQELAAVPIKDPDGAFVTCPQYKTIFVKEAGMKQIEQQATGSFPEARMTQNDSTLWTKMPDAKTFSSPEKAAFEAVYHNALNAQTNTLASSRSQRQNVETDKMRRKCKDELGNESYEYCPIGMERVGHRPAPRPMINVQATGRLLERQKTRNFSRPTYSLFPSSSSANMDQPTVPDERHDIESDRMKANGSVEDPQSGGKLSLGPRGNEMPKLLRAKGSIPEKHGLPRGKPIASLSNPGVFQGLRRPKFPLNRMD